MRRPPGRPQKHYEADPVPGTLGEVLSSREVFRRHTDWSDVDWSQSNEEIAKIKDRSEYQVRLQRIRTAPETIPPVFNDTWAGTDWSLSDEEIADLTNRSTVAVQVARRRHNPTKIRKRAEKPKKSPPKAGP